MHKLVWYGKPGKRLCGYRDELSGLIRDGFDLSVERNTQQQNEIHKKETARALISSRVPPVRPEFARGRELSPDRQ